MFDGKILLQSQTLEDVFDIKPAQMVSFSLMFVVYILERKKANIKLRDMLILQRLNLDTNNAAEHTTLTCKF